MGTFVDSYEPTYPGAASIGGGQSPPANPARAGQRALKPSTKAPTSVGPTNPIDAALSREAVKRQDYLTPGGGQVNTITPAVAADEANEHGTYPFTTSGNPHTNDQREDNSLALSHDARPGTDFPNTDQGYNTIEGQQGSTVGQTYLAPASSTLTPAEALAFRLKAGPGQKFPESPQLGVGFSKVG
jgi:hypothetical protein